MDAAQYCPKLFQMLVTGVPEGEIRHNLKENITTLVCRDTVLRFWSYDGFPRDFELA
jgi:hypothetical protein